MFAFTIKGHLERGIKRYNQRAYDDAIKDLDIYINKDGTNPRAYFYRANCRYMNEYGGRYNEKNHVKALEDINIYFEKNGNDEDGHHLHCLLLLDRGVTLYREGAYEEAMKDLEICINRNGSWYSLAYFYRASYRRIKKNYEGALEDINSYLERRDDDRDGNYLRGQLLMERDFDWYKGCPFGPMGAVKDLDICIAKDRRKSKAYFYRAWHRLTDSLDYKEALDDINIYIEENDNDAKAYFLRGKVFWYTIKSLRPGFSYTMKDSYESHLRAIKLAPNWPPPYEALCFLEYTEITPRDHLKAMSYAKKLIELDFNRNEYTRSMWAHVMVDGYIFLNDFAAAQEMVEKLQEMRIEDLNKIDSDSYMYKYTDKDYYKVIQSLNVKIVEGESRHKDSIEKEKKAAEEKRKEEQVRLERQRAENLRKLQLAEAERKRQQEEAERRRLNEEEKKREAERMRVEKEKKAIEEKRKEEQVRLERQRAENLRKLQLAEAEHKRQQEEEARKLKQAEDEARKCKEAEDEEAARKVAEEKSRIETDLNARRQDVARQLESITRDSNTANPDLVRLNQRYQDLEGNAVNLRCHDFYISRGNFYYASASKEKNATRQKEFYKKALTDYNQVMVMNPFAPGAAERVEEITKILGASVTSTLVQNSIFNPGDHRAEIEKKKEEYRAAQMSKMKLQA